MVMALLLPIAPVGAEPADSSSKVSPVTSPAPDEGPEDGPATDDWSRADTWTSPWTGERYEVWKAGRDRATRFVGRGGTFPDTSSVLRAEAAASGVAAHLYKADAPLREGYLQGSHDTHRLILVLASQPVAEHGPGVWREHAGDLARLEEQARRATDPSKAADAAAVLEALRTSVNTLLDAAAQPDVARTQAEAIQALADAGVPGAAPLAFTLNTLLVKAPLDLLPRITERPEVASVHLDALAHGELTVSVPSTGQFSYAGNGHRGDGFDVAVLDTGVDFGHPALSERARNEGRVYFPSGLSDGSFCDDAGTTDDLQGHGTHVSGIVGSLGSAGWASYRGMMTGSGSGLINLKSGWRSCSGGGLMYFSDGMNNVDWAIRLSNQRADVVTVSFGSCDTNSGNDAMDRFLDAVSFSRDIPVTVSAGNIGGGCTTQVSSPATGYNVLGVGSADDRGTTDRGDDVLSGFSRRGPTGDGRLKPDVVAPGSNIHSTVFDWETGDDFRAASGTSMAAPHVGGAAALVASAGLPGALRFKATVMNSADLSALGAAGVPNMDTGHGYMDLDTHFRWYKFNDFYRSGELAPWAPFQLLRLDAPAAADKLTLYWQRHVQYNNADAPFNPGLPSDLDLIAYSENSDAVLARSDRVIDNFEFLRGSDFGQAAGNVLKVVAHSFGSGAPTEPWGLAASSSLRLLQGPAFDAPTLTLPQSFLNGGSATVSATLRNRGDLDAHGVSLTLTLPPGYERGGENAAGL